MTPSGLQSGRDVVAAYSEEAQRVAVVLAERLGVPDLLHARGSGRVARRGWAGDIHYVFHGLGCRATTRTGQSIDFEFGTDGVVGGFDAWRVWRYAEDRCKGAFPSLDAVRMLLAEMEAEGLIRSGHDGLSRGLYHFVRHDTPK